MHGIATISYVPPLITTTATTSQTTLTSTSSTETTEELLGCGAHPCARSRGHIDGEEPRQNLITGGGACSLASRARCARRTDTVTTTSASQTVTSTSLSTTGTTLTSSTTTTFIDPRGLDVPNLLNLFPRVQTPEVISTGEIPKGGCRRRHIEMRP